MNIKSLISDKLNAIATASQERKIAHEQATKLQQESAAIQARILQLRAECTTKFNELRATDLLLTNDLRSIDDQLQALNTTRTATAEQLDANKVEMESYAKKLAILQGDDTTAMLDVLLCSTYY